MKSVLAVVAVLGVTLTAQPQDPQPASPESRPSFVEWLDDVRQEALTRGIRPAIVDEALAGVDEPMPVVLERDRTQAETLLSLEQYLARQITPARVRTGRAMVARHQATLDRVGASYGVPARIIASIWGMESNFGRFSGVRPTIAALATLAWDPRRAAFFRAELFHALDILNRGDVDVARMKGSWAGAMGQPQFMPSSYQQYAEDFDGDGRRDIWTTTPDVFASIANYLKGHGWVDGQTWGREVRVSAAVATRIRSTVARREGSCRATRDMTIAQPIAEWQRLGVRTITGAALPKGDAPAALVAGTTRFFLVYPNYDALLGYNCAHAYALGVGMLGDRLAAAAAPPRPPAQPTRTPPSRSRGRQHR